MSHLSSLCALAALIFCAPVAHGASPTPSTKRVTSGLMPTATRSFRALGFLGASASVVRARVLPPVAPRPTKQVGRVPAADGSLLFVYKGYTPQQREVLSGFVSRNYGAMVARYGAPAPEQRASGGKTITVIGNSVDFEGTPEEKAFRGATAYQPLKNPDNSTRGDGGTIYFPYNGGQNQKVNQFNFTRLVLRAFQGPNNFSYNYNAGSYNDIYQAGMADAVSLLVMYDSLSATEKATFDPSQYDSYVLHVYDLFNRPELSSAYIFPAVENPNPDVNSLLPEFRLDMAQAAWLKVGIENPNFFQRFNAAYYSSVPARQAATSIQLRAIAAGAAPQVEGLGFHDWARRQHILDNAVTTGTKILALIVPVETPAGANEETGFIAFAEAFTTSENGRDTRLTGFGSIEALDENGGNINVQSRELSASNLLNLKQNPDAFEFGAGFLNMPAPNRARITIKLSFKGAQTLAPFPYIGTGGAASQATVYGVAQNGENGTIAISNNAGNESTELSRGAFAGTKRYLSGPSVVTNLTLGGRVFKRNTAWMPAASRGVAFVLEGGINNSPFTLRTASGASQVRMISLPIFPAQSDEAEILGIAPQDLRLARYRPNLAPGTINDGVLTFGIGADRHEIYPNISAPITPGRGYWIGTGEITRTVQGSEPRQNVPYEVPLPGGWNQFGVPFNKNFSPDAIKVRYGSFEPISYAEAVNRGLVAPGIWRWQGRGGYARADGVAGATLPPFEGFYLYAIPARGVSLVFNASAASARTASSQGLWSVPLVASTNSARDASNRFGVAGNSVRLAAAKPPTGPPVVTLRFHSSGNAEADESGAGRASGWADSFLPSILRDGKWDFTVEGTKKGEGVALSWGELKGVPSDVKLTLRDLKTTKNLALRGGGSYKWTSDGLPRRFSILAARSARATLNIAPAPSRGIEVAMSLNLAARGRLEIRDTSGDTLFVLKNGDFEAKTEKFVWNGQRRDGRKAPRARLRVMWIPALTGDQSANKEFDYRP